MSKRGISLYFQIHQPYRIHPYSVFDTAQSHDYFSHELNGAEWDNKAIFTRIAKLSYWPMNNLLHKLLLEYPEFSFTLGITGTFIEQAQKWDPRLLDSFRTLVKTGRVEILAESYYHSLAFFYSPKEFARQVNLHHTLIKDTFSFEPQVIRGTELTYNDAFAVWAKEHGYHGVLAEGWDPVLNGRSPNYIYSAGAASIPVLLRNYRLSDDVSFRFNDSSWPGWPLSAETYVSWMSQSLEHGHLVNLGMDYETFGEHQRQDTGIFTFFSDVIRSWLSEPGRTFYTASEAMATFRPTAELQVPHTITWADTGRDLSAWSGNSLQQSALQYIYGLEEDILRYGDEKLIADWRYLQTSDHFYYMCTKGFADGDVHAYFSPYTSPYDAFLYYLNVIRDIRWRLFVIKNQGGLRG